jgi:hypothetical protein
MIEETIGDRSRKSWHIVRLASAEHGSKRKMN